MKLEMKEIKNLIDVFNESGLGEMEVESNGTRISLKRYMQAGTVSEVTTSQTKETAPGSFVEMSQAADPEASSSNEADDAKLVKAPIAGVFYRASAPGKKPYVSEGSKVKKGDVLCLMEAMKLMNEVISPCDGEVIAILPENAQFCEYGEAIIKIKEKK